MAGIAWDGPGRIRPGSGLQRRAVHRIGNQSDTMTGVGLGGRQGLGRHGDMYKKAKLALVKHKKRKARLKAKAKARKTKVVAL